MKKKIIALTLAASVMLTGAGYAYWTDKVTIDNTVSTGEFDVKVISASTGGRTDAYTGINGTEWGKYVYSDAYVGNHPNLSDAEKNLIKSTFTDKTVTAKLGNLFPGSSANLSVQVVNDGTIPAVFDYATVDITGDENLKSEMVYWLYYKITDQDPNTADLEKREYYTDLNTYEANLNALLAGIRLEPDQTLTIGDEGDQLGNTFTFRLPTTVDNDDNVEGKSVDFTMKINWKQHNAPLTPDANKVR
ncbi:MAG: SipW-dependent-type signal peptide-containing protein [Desulfitobacterium sp.]